MSIENNPQKTQKCDLGGDKDYVLFNTVEDVWFWFIAAQQARCDGAKYVSGAGVASRACEPVDILKILDRLYRNRRITRAHLLVLRHYGRRFLAPDPRRVKEERSYYLWVEALECMRPELERKGILASRGWVQELLQKSQSAEKNSQYSLFERENA